MTRSEWPQMQPAAVVVATVVMIGVVVVSVAQSGEMLAALLDLLCTESACQPLGLAVVGWAVVGGPLVLAGLILLLSSPGAAAQYAMLACAGLMTVGFTVMYAGLDELEGMYPDFGPLGVGWGGAFAAFLLGAMIGGPAEITSWERPRYSSTARLPSAVAPLLAIGACELLALAGVLVWVTLVR